MKASVKYAFVLALGLAVGFYAHVPQGLEKVAWPDWVDEINVVINKAIAAARPQAAVAVIDPARAALLDEDVDYRIAQRIASLAGWRSFLAAHGNGVHAESAGAEIERLLHPAKAPTAPAAEVSDGAVSEANPPGEIVGLAEPPGPEAAALTADEICKRDGDRLELLRSNPTSEEAARFANELGCETLRPQLMDLMASLGYAPPAPAGAGDSNGESADAKPTSDAAGSDPPSLGTEVAALTPDEVCKRDGDRLERLRSSPTSEEAARFANELGCETLRPQLLGLMASLGYSAPAPDAEPAGPSAKVGSALGAVRRAAAPPSETRATVSSSSVEPKRHANGCDLKSACSWRTSHLPPIVLALLGERPKRSNPFRRTPTNARPDDVRGR